MSNELINQETNNDLMTQEEQRELLKNELTQTQLSLDFYNPDVLQTVEMAKYTKIPITEISTLGSAFSQLVPMLTNATEGLYTVSLPKGGQLVHAKGTIGGYRAFTMGNQGIESQAVLHKAGAVGSNLPMLFMAVAMMGIQHEIKELQKMHTELIDIIERDKHSQLAADMEILNSFATDYQYYWENEATVTVNLNQAKNIKRNARKDMISYGKQVTDILEGKMNTILNYGAAKKANKLSERFAYSRLALYVYAFAEYMEVMLSKNFNEEYLEKTIGILKNYYDEYRVLYTKCYNEIEHTITTALGTQMVDGFATVNKFMGEQLGKVKIFKNKQVDKVLIANSEVIQKKEEERLQQIREKFITYKDSGLNSFIEKLTGINVLYNKQFELLWDKETLYVNMAE